GREREADVAEADHRHPEDGGGGGQGGVPVAVFAAVHPGREVHGAAEGDGQAVQEELHVRPAGGGSALGQLKTKTNHRVTEDTEFRITEKIEFVSSLLLPSVSAVPLWLIFLLLPSS